MCKYHADDPRALYEAYAAAMQELRETCSTWQYRNTSDMIDIAWRAKQRSFGDGIAGTWILSYMAQALAEHVVALYETVSPTTPINYATTAMQAECALRVIGALLALRAEWDDREAKA